MREFKSRKHSAKNIFFIALSQKRAPRQSAWCSLLAGALVASKLAPRAKRRGIRFAYPRAERVELARKRQAVGIFAAGEYPSAK